MKIKKLHEDVQHCWFGYYIDRNKEKKYFYMTKDVAGQDPDEASEYMEDSIPEPFTKFVFCGSIANTQAEKQGYKLVEEAKQVKVFGAKANKLNESVPTQEQIARVKELADDFESYNGDANDKESFKDWLKQFGGFTDKGSNDILRVWDYIKKSKLNEEDEYRVKFFQVFEAPKSPTENGKMIGQRGTLDAANAFGKENVGEGNYIIKAVCDDGQTRPIDNDTKPGAYKMVNEASYGGAFDIEDDQYFTRDDLNNFAEEVLGHISETFDGNYDIGGVWFENGNVTTQIVDSEGNEFQDTTHVDMRRIREPWHLKRMYAFLVATSLIAQIKSFLKDCGMLTENVMGMGKYSDKFHQYLLYLLDEGKEENLKYLALQLIRYCKEEDLKDLWLDRMEKVAKDDGFGTTADELTEGIMDEFHIAQRYLDFEIPEACKETADNLPNMTEQAMCAINKHCRKFKDILDYYSTKSSAVEEALNEDSDHTKNVSVAFDVIVPAKMSEDAIEHELRRNLKDTDLEINSYVEIHTINESLTEDVEVPTLTGPVEGAESGLAALLNEALQDELKTIQMYNDTAITARAEGFEDIASQIDEINTEENKHVGQLQELLKTVSPNAQAIDAGELEAGDDLVVVEEGINNSNKTGNNNNEGDVIMEGKERWEQIYNSFKAVEQELNNDGEAVTAVVDKMYQDNIDDPDYKKAYDKWGSGQ